MYKISSTKKLVFSALLIALEVVMTRFLQIPVLIDGFTNRINFGFLPVALGGMFGGIWSGGLIAGLADFIRAIIFPQGGAINPLFCITAFLRGVTYGAFLADKVTPKRICLASLCIFVVINVGLIPLITSFSYGGTFVSRFLTALPVSVVNLVLQLPTLLFVLPLLERDFRYHV